ncbi:MAG: outer-membrane lipoprotein carrier protein LolA, partial [Gammaproteobacteria bacterium]|nr:outer-membrane lipoprotein carrier protein LolA [Gammaproteobacteria bacterium]
MRIRSWIALALVLPAVPALAQETADDGALKRFFQTTQHLQADFTQLEYDGDGIFQKESTGRLYLSRPGRFR